MTEAASYAQHLFSCFQNPQVLAGHITNQNKNYISQAPLQLETAKWLVRADGMWVEDCLVVSRILLKELVCALCPHFLVYPFLHSSAWNSHGD